GHAHARARDSRCRPFAIEAPGNCGRRAGRFACRGTLAPRGRTVIAATTPVQRPAGAKLLSIDRDGRIRHHRRSSFADLLRPGDLVVANDAATLPASLAGIHVSTGTAIEVRLAGRRSLAPDDVQCFTAIVFGAGDFHLRTEDRPLP